jgi:hypothetical protein
VWVGILALAAIGCSAVARQHREAETSFFPLEPRSRWEYVVSRRAGRESFRFVATVRQDEFHGADGRACRIVDERYTDVSEAERFPIVYCAEGGFLHRVMS